MAEEELLPPSSRLLIKVMSKRRMWVALFVLVYAILLSSSWNLLRALLAWYGRSGGASGVWGAVWASVVLGAAFGLLATAAALAVAVPATVMTWITVLVLLAFCGKPRKALVAEGRKITAEIAAFAVKVLLREGNFVAAICAVVGYFAIFRRTREGD